MKSKITGKWYDENQQNDMRFDDQEVIHAQVIDELIKAGIIEEGLTMDEIYAWKDKHQDEGAEIENKIREKYEK